LRIGGLKIPDINPELAHVWELSDNDRSIANSSIGALNHLERCVDGDFNQSTWLDVDFPEDFQSFGGVENYFAIYSDYPELSPELQNNALMNECRRFTRQVKVITAFNELSLKKSYFIAHAFVIAINSNNILSAAILLRSYFEIVGSFVGLTNDSLIGSDEENGADPIDQIVQRLMLERNEYFKDDKLLVKAKEAINNEVDKYSNKFKGRLGHSLYRYLCNFVHPNYLSNEQILQFYDENIGYGENLDYFDVAKRADSFSIGTDHLDSCHFHTLVNSFALLTSFLHINYKTIAFFCYVRQTVANLSAIAELTHFYPKTTDQDYERFIEFRDGMRKLVDETYGRFDHVSPVELIRAAKTTKRKDIAVEVINEMAAFNKDYTDYYDHCTEIERLPDERIRDVIQTLSKHLNTAKSLSSR
jgi:hypothetical protein